MSLKRILESFSKLDKQEYSSSKSLMEEFDDIEEKDDDLIFVDNRKKSIIGNDPSFDPGFDEYDIREDKEVSNFKGTLGNVLEKHSDELSELTSKEDIFRFLDQIEPEVDQKKYLERTKANLAKKRDFVSALTYLYDIIQKGHNDGVITESRFSGIDWREKGLELADEMDREGIYNMLLATFKWMSNEDVGEMLHQNGYLEYEDSFEEALKECLSKLNEAEMSDEDKRDTEILKQIYNKTQERSNSRLTPEEKAVLSKYGLERFSDYKTIKLPGEWGEEADLFRDSDSEVYRYSGHYGRPYRSVSSGAQKINYADRARKMHDRKYARDLRRNAHTYVWDIEQDNIPTSAFKKPLDDKDPEYKGRFIDKERASLDSKASKNVRRMKWALTDRKRATKDLDTIDSTYDAKVKGIKDRYEKELADTEAGRERSRHYSQSSFNRSQETIDDLLGKK
jgi:hypothetical protein